MDKEAKKIEVLSIDEPSQSAGNVARTFAIILGLLLLLVGVVMVATLIFLIPGLGLIAGGLVVMTLNAPKSVIECPACGLSVKAEIGGKNMKCGHCETVTPVVWSGSKGNKWTSWKAWKK